MPRDTTVAHPPALAQILPGMLPAGSYTLEQLEHLATVCHKSGLFEDITDAAQAFIKILKGQELGLPVTTSMQAFDIIRKRLFIKPWAIAAKINACGYGAYRVVEQTPERCTIRFRRKFPGVGWEDCPPVTYTFEEAKAHGLVDRSPHWKTSTAHMLYQRAMGRGGAMYFPELLAGIQPPPDETPIAPEQHAQNLSDLYGMEPAPAAEAPAAADPQPSKDPDASARGGHSFIEAIEALHRAYGKDEAWLAGWWAKVCRERGVTTPAALPVSSLVELHQQIRRYYERDDPETPAPPVLESSMWRETLMAHQDDARLPAALRSKVTLALHKDSEITETRGLALAGEVLDALAAEDAGQEA